MEVALRLSPYQSPLILPKRLESVPPTSNAALYNHSNTRGDLSLYPYFSAVTLNKPTVQIFSSAVTSCHNPLPVSNQPSSSPSPRIKVSPNSLQYPPGFLGASLPDRPIPNDSDSDSIIDAMGYLTNILSSKVYDVAIESLLQLALKLSERLGVTVFSFKLRGAYNMMAKIPKEQLGRGVICSSAGNHAQGVALAAKRLGCNAVIAMPFTTPKTMWKTVERLGATAVLAGDSYDEAQTYAKKGAEEEGRTFIPPFDHPDVIMGQGTVGMEIVRQTNGPLHAIFVPVGGGGLIAGIAAYVKRVKIIGVEPSDANAMAVSLQYGQRMMLDQVGAFADDVAVKEVGEETFRICKELVDGVVLDMFEEKRSILEPAGALALARAEAYSKYYGLKGENVVAIASGANMNFNKLRVVTELANVGRQQEPVPATIMPEEPGSFKRFCELVGQMNITEFKYRCHSDKEAIVLCSVGIHMMGSRSNVQNEPGALMKFLDAFSPRWNISLFHYRGEGETGANVLVGMQIVWSEMDEFHDRANNLGYDYAVVNNHKDFSPTIDAFIRANPVILPECSSNHQTSQDGQGGKAENLITLFLW
ncbi:hypothetical protein I3842_10G003000 [Carya illinoinensis]|uniref:Threonine dehydratase n=1 Tax=Carya illinoinensis TaxID=32201 RepID=A0A922DTV8_CARIL|nr:hypothetical protein I3842_10G003000 [Carya illinoinensis]